MALSLDALLTIGVTLLALALFVASRLPAAFVALVVMVLLMALGLVTTEAGLSGFSSPATITILALFMVSGGIYRTGVVDALARRLAAATGSSEQRVLVALVLVVGPVSAFINNTAAVAILIPLVLTIARDARLSASRLLMPLSYLAMLAGTITLVGTSTNILASTLLAERTGEGFGLFEVTPVGLVIFAVGGAYVLLVTPRLLPARLPAEEDRDEDHFLTEVRVEEASPLVGRTLQEAKARRRYHLDVVRVLRGEDAFDQPLGHLVLEEGDVLVARVPRRRLTALEHDAKVTVLPDVRRPAPPRRRGAAHVVEVIMNPSSFTRRSATAEELARTFGVQVLGVRHATTGFVRRLTGSGLTAGDTVLVLATPAALEGMRADREVIVGEEAPHHPLDVPRAAWVLAVTTVALGVAAADIVPLVVAVLAAAVAMVLTGAMRPRDVWASIDWEVIFLIAGLIPLGLALEGTGVADQVGAWLAAVSLRLPDIAVVGLFYVVAVLLTALLSNAATVVLLVPITLATAADLGLRPEPLVLAVMYATSADFMTPIGYQTNLMVYGAGGYRFTDYTRAGGPLTLLLAVTTSLAITLLFPLR